MTLAPELTGDGAGQAAAPPFRPMPFRAPAVEVERREDGAVILTSPYAPAEPPRSIAHLFFNRAATLGDAPFIAARAGAGWQGLTYAQAARDVLAVAGWLLAEGASPEHGVVVLSENSIAHATVMLGCYAAEVPVTPLSPAFSLVSTDFAKLLHCAGLVAPAFVYVEDTDRFGRALAALRARHPDVRVIAPRGRGADANLDAILAGDPVTPADALLSRISPTTVAKYLFTSGSTGMPKAVPQTHAMMCALIAAREGLLEDPSARFPPRVLDWMPWSHLSAGNIAFNHNIWAGGTFFIDDGRPLPGQFARTLENFLDVAPPLFSSAPIAFEMLADTLERDSEMAARFFAGVRWMAYGGATLSSSIYDRIQALAIEHTGWRVPIITTYGATETQGITTVHWPTERVGLVGLPLPGVTLKLAPDGAKMEVRVKGPTVAGGYLGNPAATKSAFDDEGFYRLGDAARLADPDDLTRGLVFDGRVSEDFKLSSGTWVSAGIVRSDVIAACSPLIRSAVLVGQDQPFLSMMVWPAAHTDRAAFTDSLCSLLSAYNGGAGGSSRRIARFVILDTPPSIDDGEITEKGYVNQRRVLETRSATVERLYGPYDSDIIVVPKQVAG